MKHFGDLDREKMRIYQNIGKAVATRKLQQQKLKTKNYKNCIPKNRVL